CIQTGLRETDGPRCDRKPALVDRTHGDQETLPFLAEAVLVRHKDVVVVDEARVAGMDAELAVQGPGGDACHTSLQEERGHAAPALRAIQRRERQEVDGDAGPAESDLLAV